jgi:pentatricopeptide repeat protein
MSNRMKFLQSLVLLGQPCAQSYLYSGFSLQTAIASATCCLEHYTMAFPSHYMPLRGGTNTWHRPERKKSLNKQGLASTFYRFGVGKSAALSQRSKSVQSFSTTGRSMSSDNGLPSKQHPLWNSIFESDLRMACKRKNIKYFNKLIVDYGQRKRPLLSQRMFDAILRSGLQPNEYSYTCLINAHVRNGNVQYAEATFQAMVTAGIDPGVAAYTAMIKGFANNGLIYRFALVRLRECVL